MNTSSCTPSRRPLAVVLATSIAAAISLIPAVPGIGNVGKKIAVGSGSFVRVTLPSGPAVTHTIVTGQTAEQIRDSLVTLINAQTTFLAAVVSDPVDPNLAAFQVTTASGGEPSSLQIDETDTNIDDIGARFAMGKGSTIFKKVNTAGNSIVGNGVYRLKVELWDNPDYSVSFDTAVAPNNTAAGLDVSIKASLIANGFGVTESATHFTVTRFNDMIVATQVDCTDSGVVSHDVLMQSSGGGPGGLPSLTDLGLFALMATLTGIGMTRLRRRRK